MHKAYKIHDSLYRHKISIGYQKKKKKKKKPDQKVAIQPQNVLETLEDIDIKSCQIEYNLEDLSQKVKMQYLHFRSHAEYFPLSWKIPEVISRRPIPQLKGVSTIPILCFIFVDTAFLLCGADILMELCKEKVFPWFIALSMIHVC